MYVFNLDTYYLALVTGAHIHVRWAEFIPTYCLSSVVCGNRSLKMNKKWLVSLLYSNEFSKYGATYCIKSKSMLYPGNVPLSLDCSAPNFNRTSTPKKVIG